MDEKEMIEIALPIVKKVVNWLSSKQYKQMSVIPYKDGSGFHLDYDLTSRGGEWNDEHI